MLGECFRGDLVIIYNCAKTDQPGGWPAEEPFLKAGLFPTDRAGSASPTVSISIIHTSQDSKPQCSLFLSVEASGRLSLSHGYSFMYERSEQHVHSLVLPGSSGRSVNLCSKTPSEILLDVHPPPASFSNNTNLVQNYEKQWNPHIHMAWKIRCLKAHNCMSSMYVTLQLSSTYETL